jgi:lipopolysaccharide/colanic/teichoic acid biosynthesis glycosyltransferase
VYERKKLAVGGKFQDDFRVTDWGRIFRRLWLDELPMLINWLRGDLKFVGVRPLSRHYLSLYPSHLVEYRKRFKPGLVPPYYADLPRGFDEIVRSEEEYLRAYEQHGWRTDLRYLSKAIRNVIFRGVRSS